MKKLVNLTFLIFFASCSTTVDFKIPGVRFHDPETSGDTLKGHASVGYGQATKYETATLFGDTIFSSDVSVDTDQKIIDSAGYTLDLGIGVVKDLDFYYFRIHDSADNFGFKYQVLGDSSSKGHKLSILASYGQGDEDKTGHSVRSQESKRVYNASLDFKAYDFETIYGYRYNDYLLPYININFSRYLTETTLRSDSFQNEFIKANVSTYALLLGLKLTSKNKKRGLILEGGFTRSKWDRNYRSLFPIGISTYYTF